MTPELHRRASELFDQALALPPDRRQPYLEEACSSDMPLRQYVAALLSAEQDAPDSFLEQSAMQTAAALLVQNTDAGAGDTKAVPGSQIGGYLIGEQIGMGGMGTVYVARDLRLDRKVAVKVLPVAFAQDPDRVQRFRQEARAISQLNHPNIVSIYDAEFEQGYRYIATEFVDGRTLRQLSSTGPLELKVLLETGIQICAALDAAHQAGIVHRDIKPENIMLRPDGIVKVLDFGLAKLTETAGSKPSFETAIGSIAGTPQYFSPEQLLGKKAGLQSDIFSLGVVLYELSTGTRPFEGPTDAAICSAILNTNPSAPSAIVPALGKEFDTIVARALEKDPEMRFQTAADLRAVLRLLSRRIQSGSWSNPVLASQPRRRSRQIAIIALATLLAVSVLSFFVLLLRRHPVSPPLPDRFTQLTESPGEDIFPSLSPDAKDFIYSAAIKTKWDIYRERVGGSTPENLTADSGADDREAALSHDGSHIAFRSERDGGGLFVMEATGENPARLTHTGYLPSWSPDGKSIVYCDVDFTFPSNRSGHSHLLVVDLATGVTRVLPDHDGAQSGRSPDAIQPSWSPHGDRIAYWGLSANAARNIRTVPAKGGESVPVTSDASVNWNPFWSPAGDYLYFLSDRGGSMNLWRVAVNERSGHVNSNPEPVTTPASYMMFPSFSADGSKFIYSQATYRVNLFSIAFDPGHRETIGQPAQVGDPGRNITMFDFSPDGGRIVYDTIGAQHEDLWIQSVDGSGRRRLVEGGKNHGPAWSPAGDEIAFFSNRAGNYQEYAIHPDGSGLRALTALPLVGSFGMQAPTWIDGGKRLIVGQGSGGPAVISLEAPLPVIRPQKLPGFNEPNTLSLILWPPVDGTAVGYFLDGSERLFTYSMKDLDLTQLDVKGVKPVMVPGMGNRAFLYIRGTACYLYDLDLKREKQLFSTSPNRIYCIRPSPDGKHIYFTETIRQAAVWLAQMQQSNRRD